MGGRIKFWAIFKGKYSEIIKKIIVNAYSLLDVVICVLFSSNVNYCLFIMTTLVETIE